jgi:hypothetical protein
MQEFGVRKSRVVPVTCKPNQEEILSPFILGLGIDSSDDRQTQTQPHEKILSYSLALAILASQLSTTRTRLVPDRFVVQPRVFPPRFHWPTAGGGDLRAGSRFYDEIRSRKPYINRLFQTH